MRSFALLCLLVWPWAGSANQEATAWLDKMLDAIESLNYDGTFILVRGDHIETMEIVHGNNGNEIRERLLSLSGEAREVIRDQDVLTCVWPSSSFVVVESSRKRVGIPATVPGDVDQLSPYYHLTVHGSDRVAGYPCRYIEIRPTDTYRYGYRLCVAEESGMLLKSEMQDPQGAPIEQVMFTSIRFHEAIPKQRFESTMMDEGFTWHTVGAKGHLTHLEPDEGWRIHKMPPGFKVTEVTRRPMAASARPVQHMVVSDGLASVSVFIAEPEPNAAVGNGLSRQGAMHLFATQVDKHPVTVVGEVPELTVKMIGQSIQHQASHD